MSSVWKLLSEFNLRFTSGNEVDVPARVSVPRDDWRELHDSVYKHLELALKGSTFNSAATALLDDIRKCFTREDDLPDGLIGRIDSLLADTSVVQEVKPLTRESMKLGGKYNWKNQKERLVYLGHNGSGNGYWHQFALVESPYKIWCEVLSHDLHMLEETILEDEYTHGIDLESLNPLTDTPEKALAVGKVMVQGYDGTTAPIGHWDDGPETYVIVKAKDVPLGAQTYHPVASATEGT